MDHIQKCAYQLEKHEFFARFTLICSYTAISSEPTDSMNKDRLNIHASAHLVQSLQAIAQNGNKDRAADEKFAYQTGPGAGDHIVDHPAGTDDAKAGQTNDFSVSGEIYAGF